MFGSKLILKAHELFEPAYANAYAGSYAFYLIEI